MSRPKSIQPLIGREMADRLGSIPTGYFHVVNAREELQKYYNQLETYEEKKAFFDQFISVQQRDFPRAWAAIYETVDLIQQSEWYWKEKGFKKFDEFWHSLGEHLFGQWAELEEVYHYAHLAAPELFNQDWNKAQKVAREAFNQRLIAVHHATTPAERRAALTLQHLLPKENQTDEFRAGLRAGSSGHTAYTRLARIRRQNPEIAAKIVNADGKYVSINGQGKVKIDWKSAERDAGFKERPVSPKKTDKVAQVKGLLDKLTPNELAQVSNIVNKMMKGLAGKTD